jgi:hypothetical protein
VVAVATVVSALAELVLGTELDVFDAPPPHAASSATATVTAASANIVVALRCTTGLPDIKATLTPATPSGTR